MRRGIFWGSLGVATTVLILSAIAGAVIRQQLVHRSEVELTRQAEVTARLIEGIDLFGDLRSEPPRRRFALIPQAEALLSLVREIGGHDYVEAARITNLGLQIVTDGTVLLSQIPPDLESADGLEVEIDGEAVLAAVRTVKVNEHMILRIAIGRQEPLLDSAFFTWPMWLSLLIGAGLALLLAWGVSRKLGRRLEVIERAAREIADGVFAARIHVTEDDELGRLGAAFNAMASHLEAAQQRERDFLMSVGHDLRTPLTTIRGYAEGLDGGEIDTEDLPRVAGVLHRQADRLSRLVEDLMLLSRLEAREFTLRFEKVDVAAHLKEILDAHRVRADELQLRLEVSLEPIREVSVDPERLGQILGNLIDNAFRYTQEGGRVAVRLTAEPSRFAVTVADTGPGIEPKDIPRVFERLYVAQRYRSVRPEGSGLGLSIVKELVDAMGGTLEVLSDLGQGTEVTVFLPSDDIPKQ